MFENLGSFPYHAAMSNLSMCICLLWEIDLESNFLEVGLLSLGKYRCSFVSVPKSANVQAHMIIVRLNFFN